jgi:serine phosphatase RsbU (regulator of sigma subunit)
MHLVDSERDERLRKLEEELENLRSIMEHVYDFPDDFSLTNIEIAGATFPLNGVLGGDHIIFVDFNRRFNLDGLVERALRKGRDAIADKLRANNNQVGVLLADVSGHSMTDALLAAMLHQAFLTGVLYELEVYGHVTPGLFEILNTRFYRSSSVTKYLTMIYGEISEDGRFRFISAGHPRPMVFSAEYDTFVSIDASRTRTFHPVGMFPSELDPVESMATPPIRYKESYTVNEVNLMGRGDIMLLFTDGVLEHSRADESYAPGRLEEVVRSVKNGSPKDTIAAIHDDISAFAPATDDMSIVAIKKTR